MYHYEKYTQDHLLHCDELLHALLFCHILSIMPNRDKVVLEEGLNIPYEMGLKYYKKFFPVLNQFILIQLLSQK